MSSDNVSRPELDREILHVRDAMQVRFDALSLQIVESSKKTDSMFEKISVDLKEIRAEQKSFNERLIKMDSDARWFRRICAAVFTVANVALGCWLKGVFQ